VPETLGKNCSINPGNNCYFANFDIAKYLSPPKEKEKVDEVRNYKKRMVRPAVLDAPGEPLVGSAGSYVIADFTIQNQSDHNLPKYLVLRKTSVDDVGFTEIEGKN
jgi:hypothetical protein